MAEPGSGISTGERCATLWEQRYPHVKKPQTYLKQWYDEDAPRAARVLDAGCGPGGAIDHAASAPAAMTVGMDPDYEAVRRNPNVAFKVVGSLHALPFREGAFDLVTAQYVLEHIADPRQGFAELGRVLRSGGAFLFTTTNAAGYLGAAIRIIPQSAQAFIKRVFLKMSGSEIHPVYMRCNTRGRLRRLLSGAGFAHTEFIFIGGPFYFAFSHALFRLALVLERLTDGRLRHLKFYIVGRARRR